MVQRRLVRKRSLRDRRKRSLVLGAVSDREDTSLPSSPGDRLPFIFSRDFRRRGLFPRNSGKRDRGLRRGGPRTWHRDALLCFPTQRSRASRRAKEIWVHQFSRSRGELVRRQELAGHSKTPWPSFGCTHRSETTGGASRAKRIWIVEHPRFDDLLPDARTEAVHTELSESQACSERAD